MKKFFLIVPILSGKKEFVMNLTEMTKYITREAAEKAIESEIHCIKANGMFFTIQEVYVNTDTYLM